jgi:hypothetical protein
MSNTISGNTVAVNAKLFCTDVHFGNSTTPLITYSDASGNYSFAGLAPGTYEVKAAFGEVTGTYATGYSFHRPQQTVVITIGNPQDQAGVNFTPALINSAN